ncbi:MAG TPA: L-threonylcarbamoyladenylate synthase [Cyclobacteriaceae bacterium]|nr:L-threonylcarbamoyladenylate synthase [Cyclobacteriaceae bacterium]
MAETGTDISIARDLLKRGDLVAVPTETVYGLAGNALDPISVARIFEVKNRPSFDPLIVHIHDLTQLSKYVMHVPVQAERLAKEFWPGPLTLLLKKRSIIPDLVTSGLDTVGIRCPNHQLTQNLLRQIDFPLAAPSANPFGFVSPTTATHVTEQLGSKIKYVLDGGPCPIGIESTIVGFENNKTIIYRLGGVPVESIEKIVGDVEIAATSGSPKAPGQLKSHYAPGKKMFTADLEKAMNMIDMDRVALLSFERDYGAKHQVILSPMGNLAEAAKNLFGALRQLDKMPVELILAELVPDEGLGRAINDRLKRASAK